MDLMLSPAMQKKIFILQEKFYALANKIKIACFLILAFLMYAYLLVVMKTLYYKMRRLDTIDDLTVKTQKMIHELHLLDQTVAIQADEYDEFDTDY